MRPCHVIATLLLIALTAFPLQAQWSGHMDVTTGLGGMTGNDELGVGLLGHLLTQGNVSLRYQTEKFSWNTTVGGRWEPKSSDNSRLDFNRDQPDELNLELVYKTVKTRPLQVNVRTSFDWKPSPDRRYTAWLSYRYKNDRARNVSNSLSGTLSLDGRQIQYYYANPRALVDDLRLEDMDSHLASCYYELPRMNEHAMAAGATGTWRLGDKSSLLGSFSLSTVRNLNHTVWSVFKSSDDVSGDIDEVEAFHRGDAWMYRITPSSIDMDLEADIHLLRIVRDGDVRFNWAPGFRLFGNHSVDQNSGASLADIDAKGNYIWRDSLRLRENFDFLAFQAAPFVAAEYRGKKIEVQADYSLHFYFCRLNDDTRRQPLNLQTVAPVGNARFSWKLSDIHKLSVTHAVGVDYPDYLKICWYDRTGGYADQLYRGNSELVSTLHSRYSFVYELLYKRFRYRMSNAVTRKINEMDQTWSNEEIEGRLYKVFLWVNSADSWSFGTAHRIGWEGKWGKGGVGVEYNQSRRTAKADGAVKDASDWRLTADADANLGKGWSLGARLKYQSAVATFFSSFNEYWEFNTHIQKKFRNITLFFDGNDLLDNARQTTVESADGRQLWLDVARDNRRLFLLGIQWNF